MIIDIILILLLALVVFLAARRGFFITVLRLGAWVVAIVLSRVLSQWLAEPLYNAFFAQPARRMVEQSLGNMIDGSQAAQYAQQIIADLPDVLSQLAARVGDVTPEYLLENLETQRFTAENAAYVLEQSIIAPIAVAVIGLVMMIVLFFVLLAVCRLVVRRIEGVRKLPVLRQADRLLGAALGLLKGLVLLFVVALVLQAAAAFSQEGAAFPALVDASRIITFLT